MYMKYPEYVNPERKKTGDCQGRQEWELTV